jgi:autophagy-related protein 2
MASFIPSVVKNRLLKYGLSKLGLLDTDGWELDKLGIALGTKSTVELKDVGLRVDVR